jgi:hypothetical protein
MATDSRGDMLLARNYDRSNIQSIVLYTHPKKGYSSVSTVSFGLKSVEAGRPWGDHYRIFFAPYLPQDGMMTEDSVFHQCMCPAASAKPILTSQPSVSMRFYV